MSSLSMSSSLLPSLAQQHVLILGLGISGASMARWCASQGARVTVADTRAHPPELAAIAALQEAGCDVQFKAAPMQADLVLGTDIKAVFKSPGLSPASVAGVMQAAKASGLWVGNELSLFNHALRHLKETQSYAPCVLAVTGTNGKTTTTALAGLLVARAGQRVAVAGNIGPALLDTLAARLNDLPQVWVLELSSFQLDGVDDFEPTAAVVLNVTQDHLDWHETMAAYAAAKENIYGKHKAKTQIHVTPGLPTRLDEYGIENVGGVNWLVRATPATDALPVRVRKGAPAPDMPFVIQRLMPADALRIRGLHNATNALAALALAVRAGCLLAPMLYGLREYEGEPHRMRLVAVCRDVQYIDDSKGTNVGATVAALHSLGIERTGKKILLILGGQGKGQDFSPLLPFIERHVRVVVLIGQDASLIEATLAPLRTAQCLEILSAQQLEQAVQQCAERAMSGEVVLLSPACASLDMFKDYKHRGAVFADAVHALVQEGGLA